MAADPTDKATAVNEFRMRFLRLDHGATDENSDASVPPGSRDDFLAHVRYHKEFAEAWFERNCNLFGATDGTWATVPELNRADALRYFGCKIAEHENKCEYEFAILKLSLEEQAEETFDEEMEWLG